jgi:ABC-type Co2+ transport system permease subunit
MPSTVTDKALIVPGLSYVFARTILSLLGSPFRGAKGASTVGEHVQNTAFRTMFTHLTTGQLQYATTPITQVADRADIVPGC